MICFLLTSRFVNDKGSVIERFLGLQHVSDTTSSSLKEALDSILIILLCIFEHFESISIFALSISELCSVYNEQKIFALCYLTPLVHF
jgi:hypothetical protein